jgi:fructokinase
MKQQVAVIGEGVIDRFIEPTGVRDVIGGSPLNTAVAMRRAGVDATWWAKVSNSVEGKAIFSYAQQNSVTGPNTSTVEAPAAIVNIELNSAGIPRYDFAIANAADWQWSVEDLEGLSEFIAVQVGSLTSVMEPAASNILRTLNALRTRSEQRPTISYDPNIRPKAADSPEDEKRIKAIVQQLVAVADIVKVSDEDLEWIDTDTPPAETARGWSELEGVQLVVMTRGANGAIAFAGGEEVAEIPGVQVEVVDTVGAGDTFMAWLLKGILDNGSVPKESDHVAAILHKAAKAAAVTCSRSGCNPPLLSEVD